MSISITTLLRSSNTYHKQGKCSKATCNLKLLIHDGMDHVQGQVAF